MLTRTHTRALAQQDLHPCAARNANLNFRPRTRRSRIKMGIKRKMHIKCCICSLLPAASLLRSLFLRRLFFALAPLPPLAAN